MDPTRGCSGSTTCGTRLMSLGAPLSGSTHRACSGRVKITQSSNDDESVSSSAPAQRTIGSAPRPTNDASHGPGGTGTSSPVGMPSSPTAWIEADDRSSTSSAGSPTPRSRRNHGCHPAIAGIGRWRACTSTVTVRCASSSSNRCTTWPPNGHGSPSSVRITQVASPALTADHGCKCAMPWFACGGLVNGRS